MISIVSPIFNEQECIDELILEVVGAIEKTGETYEYILVDNGSTDNSLTMIKAHRAKNSNIKYVSLSRNFGHQGGLIAGLANASGDAVITLDGDLQHPPQLIPEMIRHWRAGRQVVYTTKIDSRYSLRISFTKLFYRLISRITDLNLKYGQSDFRLMDRKIVDVILGLKEADKFLRGMVQWVGFDQAELTYQVRDRFSGSSKFSLLSYFRFALDSIFSFSTVPLKLMFWNGLIFAGFCLLYGLDILRSVVMHYFFSAELNLPPGWLTITVSIFFIGALQLVSMGVLGEYIAKIFEQTKSRPSFLVSDKDLE